MTLWNPKWSIAWVKSASIVFIKREPAALPEVDGLINLSQAVGLPRRGKKKLYSVSS